MKEVDCNDLQSVETIKQFSLPAMDCRVPSNIDLNGNHIEKGMTEALSVVVPTHITFKKIKKIMLLHLPVLI